MSPRSSDRLASPGDLAACRTLLANGSRSFWCASLVLPRRIRDRATALYAFCRVADDAIDRDPAPARALEQLRVRLDRIYEGRPLPHAADRAFADVARAQGLPRALPDALLEGFAWDAEGRRYETLSDLLAYAARVAGTVGAMMTLVMDRREPDVLARACDLGVAMQLTNIARDVGEDARAGRIYLPLAWLREAGIDPDAFLADPRHSPALGAVVDRLLAAAEGLYARSSDGIAALPAACRPGMHAARRLYAEIGHEVARAGFDGVSARRVVGASRKLAAVGAALAAAMIGRRGRAFPPLPETAFLVEAAAAEPAGPRVESGIESPVGWMLDLIITVEQRRLEGDSRPVHPGG